MLGKLLGHNKILDRLGAGGTGGVWLAEDLELEMRERLRGTLRQIASETEGTRIAKALSPRPGSASRDRTRRRRRPG